MVDPTGMKLFAFCATALLFQAAMVAYLFANLNPQTLYIY
jgi:hypothetical protein